MRPSAPSLQGDYEEPLRLVAGELRVDLLGTDLFAVYWGGTEVAQRIYVAVRDAPWNTIPGVIERRTVSQRDDGFTVQFRCLHHFGSIDFAWDGVITGSADGTLHYRMAGVALGDFDYSKIGLNIHHPLAPYRERNFEAVSSDGIVTGGRLSGQIVPQDLRDGVLTAMFDEFAAITFDLDGLSARFQFAGDEFEMQDHRNWSDANYKTYGTPLKRGFPFAAHRWDTFEQSVELHLGPATAPVVAEVPLPLRLLAVDNALPAIGHLWEPRVGESKVGESTAVYFNADSDQPVPDDAVPAPRDRFTPAADFLRVELDDVGQVAGAFEQLARSTGSNAIPIELVLRCTPDSAAGDARQLALELPQSILPVIRVIIVEKSTAFSSTKGATPDSLVSAFLESFRAAGCRLPVLSGGEQNFSEINRSCEAYGGLHGIAFGLNPQVHAADNRSVMQNASGVIDITESCRKLYPGAFLSIGPVRLRGKDGPYPAGPPSAGNSSSAAGQEAGPGGQEAGADERERTLFGAAWVVAYLRACTVAGVDATTIFPRAGADGGSPASWVYAQVEGNIASSPPRSFVSERVDDRVACVGWSTAGGRRILVANLLDTAVEARIELPFGSATISIVDEQNLAAINVAADPAALSTTATPHDGILTIALGAFAVACVDSSANPEAP